MKKITVTILLVSVLCFLLTGCEVLSSLNSSSPTAVSSTELSTADKTLESTEGMKSEIENSKEQVNSKNSEDFSSKNTIFDGVSWFPLGILDSNDWSIIKKEAEASGFKTSDCPGIKLIQGEKVSAPDNPGTTNSNMAQIMLFDNTEEIKSVAIEDFSMDWSRVAEYASENPSIEHFAVLYSNGVLDNRAIGEMHLGERPVFVVLTYNDELQRTYIELTTYDSSVLDGKYNGSMYQLDLDSWSEMKIIK